MPKEALILVDIQEDFCPGGRLAVKGGDEVVEPSNRLSSSFRKAGKPVYVTRDWHDKNNTAHMGPGRWPEHCIRGTEGANFHPGLDLTGVTVISKGTGTKDDGYSGFEGHTGKGKTLVEDLQKEGVGELVVGGLATDYCVRATVLDARKKGYRVTVVEDAIRAVDITPGDGDRAVTEMKAAGAKFATSDIIIRSIK